MRGEKFLPISSERPLFQMFDEILTLSLDLVKLSSDIYMRGCSFDIGKIFPPLLPSFLPSLPPPTPHSKQSTLFVEE